MCVLQCKFFCSKVENSSKICFSWIVVIVIVGVVAAVAILSLF